MTNRPSDPLEFEAVYKEINRIAEEDALFSIDVGDNIINSFRYLHLTPRISGLFPPCSLRWVMVCQVPWQVL